jgi:double-stranded uracil-DNA glycosylase
MLGAASSSAHVLPDLLKPGLKIVFCGTAAGNVSAARGAYYAHPQNRFWSALHAFGLTPRQLKPEEYPELPHWGLGLTDIAKHVSGMDRELPAHALGPDACAALEAKVTAMKPKWLAFTSLTAGRRYLRRAAGFGEQPERIGQPAYGSSLRPRQPQVGTGRARSTGGARSPTRRDERRASSPLEAADPAREGAGFNSRKQKQIKRA